MMLEIEIGKHFVVRFCYNLKLILVFKWEAIVEGVVNLKFEDCCLSWPQYNWFCADTLLILFRKHRKNRFAFAIVNLSFLNRYTNEIGINSTNMYNIEPDISFSTLELKLFQFYFFSKRIGNIQIPSLRFTVLSEKEHHVITAKMPSQIVVFSNRTKKLFVISLNVERYLRVVSKVREIKMAICGPVVVTEIDHLLEM